MKDPFPHLSRREREIMEIIFTAREATVADLEQRLSNAPTRPALRSLLTILEGKGHLTHTKRGREFVYHPAQAHEGAARSALGRVLSTFFDGSFRQALASYLSDPKARITQDELDDIAAFVADAKQRKNAPTTPKTRRS